MKNNFVKFKTKQVNKAIKVQAIFITVVMLLCSMQMSGFADCTNCNNA